MENKLSRDIAMAERVAAAVAEAGGRTYYVGGFVRDRLMGIENKDVDIEIHGIPFRDLEQILSRFGEQKVMGASFGIFGLKHYDLDIAMPRSERANGRGHRDFEIYVDPFIGPEKAAMRRDFTINAMMQDVLTGEILDFYGGRDDLKKKEIRHVNDGTFIEDPLRVLRAAQFAARFEFRIAENTRKLCRTMDLSALSRERIFGELEKALLKARKPSVFFEELRAADQLDLWFPELLESPSAESEAAHEEMKILSAESEAAPGELRIHSAESEAAPGELKVPSGRADASSGKSESSFQEKLRRGTTVSALWTPVMHSLDSAAFLRERAKEPLRFMLSALCMHMTAEETACFLDRLSSETRQRGYVLNMVALHGSPMRLLRNHACETDFMRMYDASVCPEDLLLLCGAEECYAPEASPAEMSSGIVPDDARPDCGACSDRGACPDHGARPDCASCPDHGAYPDRDSSNHDSSGNSASADAIPPRKRSMLQEMLMLYHERMNSPCVMGRDLIAAGIKPGAEFKSALQYAHELQIAGIPKEQALRQTVSLLTRNRGK